MIKSENRRAWFFYEPDEPVAMTVYNPVTDSHQYLVIVEEPSEGGPDITTHYINKTMVAAALGISNEEAQIHQGFVEEFDGYDVPIPQVLKDMTGKYFIGILNGLEGGKFYSEKTYDRTFVSRREAVNVLLSDKYIHERIICMTKCELPF